MQLEVDSVKLPSISLSLPILIKQTSTQNTNCVEEYDLICSNFDPNKCSPPDEWSQRLLKRLGNHNDYNNSLRRVTTYRNK